MQSRPQRYGWETQTEALKHGGITGMLNRCASTDTRADTHASTHELTQREQE
jgi:hypothetical protein